jgi:hypothetical protein
VAEALGGGQKKYQYRAGNNNSPWCGNSTAGPLGQGTPTPTTNAMVGLSMQVEHATPLTGDRRGVGVLGHAADRASANGNRATTTTKMILPAPTGPFQAVLVHAQAAPGCRYRVEN